MNDVIEELIEILDEVEERIEALADRVAAEAQVEPDFGRPFAATEAAVLGRRIRRLRMAAHEVEHAVQSLEDAKEEDDL
ncbi:hypothetical protein GCM10022286_00290 [Gryllotalpicola daejeonensis]|uniref:Uncharacterized protein n=1 Tax=Gryllotalpicola daejeonensis TaxID=993087 RepID=A0ABP7ZCV8_9MICO